MGTEFIEGGNLLEAKKMVSSRKYRDVTIMTLSSEQFLVIACDSAGAIGPKQADVVTVPGYVLGRLTARVALLEVLAVGGWPICVVGALCVEPEPTGLAINQGIADEIQVLGIKPEDIMTGSTEKNMLTIQSGLGITVVGMASPQTLKVDALQPGDGIALLGFPKLGQEIQMDDPELVTLQDMITLGDIPGIREIIPVGSRGIAGEVKGLADYYGLQAVWGNLPQNLDLQKSAGPSSCLLAMGDRAALQSLQGNLERFKGIIGLWDVRNGVDKGMGRG